MIGRRHTKGIPMASASMFRASVPLFRAAVGLPGHGTETGHKRDMSPAPGGWMGDGTGHPPIRVSLCPPPQRGPDVEFRVRTRVKETGIQSRDEGRKLRAKGNILFADASAKGDLSALRAAGFANGVRGKANA